MSKILRATQKIFGSGALVSNPEQFKKFGGYAAGDLADAANPTVMQSLAAWLGGWFSAIDVNGSPAAEDFNSLGYVTTYQLAYLLQQGIAEWDPATTYFIGSVVNVLGTLYISQTDNNLNNSPLASPADWRGIARSVTASSGAPASVGGATPIGVVGGGDDDEFLRGNASAWTARALAPTFSTSQSQCLIWVAELALFVGVGAAANNQGQTSPDGKVWTSRVIPGVVNQWNSVCWSPKLKLLCAVASFGVNRVATSPDGIAWSAHAEAETNSWNSVCWDEKNEVFVAVSFDGVNRVMTSPDGSTWTSHAVTAEQWMNVCYAPDKGIVVAVGQTGANRVMISSDGGVSWSYYAAAEANPWLFVCYSRAQGKFVAVAPTGANRVMYSYNGYKWYTAVAAAAQNWNRVIYCSGLDLFYATNFDVSTANMLSADGITWEARAFPGAANAAISLAYSDELAILAVQAALTNYSSEVTDFTANPKIAVGSVAGQRKTLIGCSNASPVILRSGNGIYVKQPRYLKSRETATFAWDVDANLWTEVRQ